MTCSTPSGSRDILSKPLLAFFLFWLPAIAIGVTGGSHFHRHCKSGSLDSCALGHGNLVRRKRYPMPPRALLPYRAVFPGNGGRHSAVWMGSSAAGRQWLDCSWPDNSHRCHRVVLPAGAVSRKVPQVPGGRESESAKTIIALDSGLTSRVYS